MEQVEGRTARAVQIAALADRLSGEEGIVALYVEGHPGVRYVEAARAALDEGALDEAETAGRSMEITQALDLAQ